MNEEGKLFLVTHFSYFVVVGLVNNCVWSCPGSELVEYFRAQMRKDPDMASAVAAIRTLLEFLKRDKGVFIHSQLYFAACYDWSSCVSGGKLSLPPLSGETILGLRESLTWATDCLTGEDSSVAVSSGGELFLRFISLTSLEHQVSETPPGTQTSHRLWCYCVKNL